MLSKKNLENKQFTHSIGRLVTAVLLVLMISSAICTLPIAPATIANAQVTSSSQTTIPSNLLQYEWKMGSADPENTFSSAGPGPDTPSVQWSANLPNIGWGITAFNGLVFVQGDETYAVNAATGQVVWSIPKWGSIAKIDNTYMMLGSSCLKIADGTLAWTAPSGFSYSKYVSEMKMFISAKYCWSLPDPSQPPTMVWNNTASLEGGAYWGIVGAYGDGRYFYFGGDGQLHAINATTGQEIWQAATTCPDGFQFGAVYANGVLYQGDLANNMNAWNATTGKLLWRYNPETYYGFWASDPAYFDGIVYEMNQDTYTYAVNATTGQLVWRYKGPGLAYAGDMVVGGGKVYFQSGEAQYRDPVTGLFGQSETVCLNAYTGSVVWSLPIEVQAPWISMIVAYGNVYCMPTRSPQVAGSYTYVGGQNMLWCISSAVTDWSMFMGSPTHNTIGNGPTNLTLLWKFPTDNQIFSAPTCSNGIIYFGDLDKNIYAVNANTGAKIWSFTTGFAVRSSVAVVDGRLYIGADDGNFYCLDAANGNQIWKTSAGGITNSALGGGLVDIRGSPIVSDGKVYAGSLDGNLYCLDTSTGTVVWKYQTGGPIESTPTVDGNAIYVTSSTQATDGTVLKLDAAKGAVIWSLSIPYELSGTPGEGNFLLASPTIANDLGLVFVRNGQLDNYGINATTGKIIWTNQTFYNAATGDQLSGVIQVDTPLYADGSLYLNNYYSISCVNPKDGTTIWSTYLSREDISYGITYAPGRIYVVTEARAVYVLNSETGAKISFALTGGQMRSAPTPYNGNLYVGCSDWNLYCFGEASSQQGTTNQPVSNPTATPYSAPTATPQSSSSSSTNTTNNSTTTYMIVAAVAVIVIVAIAAIALARRKKKT